MHGSRVSAVRMSSSLCHLTFSLLIFHPSLLLLFLDCHSRPRPHRLWRPRLPAELSDLKAQVKRTPHEDELFGYRAKSALNTGYEPKKFDKNTSVDDDATLINDPDHNFWDFSKTMNENARQFGVHTVFESSVLNFFALVILFLREKVKKACNRETVAWQRETEEREGFAISVAKSMSMKSRRNSIRSHSFPTHKEFCSDERDLRGHLEWRAQHAFLGENQFIGNYTRPSTTWRSKIMERSDADYDFFWVTPWARISKTTINGRHSMDRLSSTWKKIFV